MYFNFQNGKEYLGDIYNEGNSSTVRLKGFANETGTYACRNNYGERYRHFTVTLDDGKLSETEKIAIAVSLTLLLLIGAGVSIGLKLFLDKVIGNKRSGPLLIIIPLLCCVETQNVISGCRRIT